MTALILIFLTGIICLFTSLFGRKSMLPWFAGIGVAAAIVAEILSWNAAPEVFREMLLFNSYSKGFSILALLTTLLILLGSNWGFSYAHKNIGDHLALMIFSLCGAMILFSFDHLVMLFLGIEILSIPLYVLAGSKKNDLSSNEAALKYFLMGAFSTGILLFGIAFVFGATHSFQLSDIFRVVQSAKVPAEWAYLKIGILFICVGLLFKIAAAPFHFWSPDVYQGSPTIVTAFMTTIVKMAAIAAFIKLMFFFKGAAHLWALPIAIVAGATMLFANLAALWQSNFKRLLAYSSIGNAGYLLLAVLIVPNFSDLGELSKPVLIYLWAYSVATIGAFFIFLWLKESENGNEELGIFRGLGKEKPHIALAMTACMLSIAGIPPLAGFFGKFFLFTAAFEFYPGLVILAMITSAISFAYYSKIIIEMYFRKREDSAAFQPIQKPPVHYISIIVLIILITTGWFSEFILSLR